MPGGNRPTSKAMDADAGPVAEDGAGRLALRPAFAVALRRYGP